MAVVLPNDFYQLLEEAHPKTYVANAIRLACIAAKIRSAHAKAPCSRDCFDARCGVPDEETFRTAIRLLRTCISDEQTDLNKWRLKSLVARTFRCATRHSYTVELFSFDLFI